tara:strand:+ start:692 stop:2254 length:1563 start_codon:yes stop_codon:yes gene_type:complete
LNNKLEHIEKIRDKNSIKILIILITSAIIIRLYFTPFNIPINLDGIDYFAFAVAMSRDGPFPNGYLTTNIGWSSFVSIFFSIIHDQEMLTLMNIQRILSIIVSTSIAIPVYFLTKIFFKKEISILAATLILFDPRLIENSILGITDSLFILLVILGIYFIFHQKGKLIYLSFIFISLSAFVRYEGLLLIIPLMISYILKSKEFNFSKIKFVIGVALFLSIIIPLNFINYEDNGTTIFDHVFSPITYISQNVVETKESSTNNQFLQSTENKTNNFIENAITGLIKFIAWSLVPIFLIFIILSIIFIPKKITKNKIIFGIFFLCLMVPSIYAYGREMQDMRYILILLPIFTLFSCYGLNYLINYNLKNNLKKIVVIITAIIISSFVFTDYQKQDNSLESEMYTASLLLSSEANGVNEFVKDKYIKVADLQNNWPELLLKNEKGEMVSSTKKFSTNGFTSLIEFIKFNEDKGLTHLLVKEKNREKILDEIFGNEINYKFLEKIYDSDNIIKYKIFKINYEKLE